jgi:restriction endonuclease S subunit
VEATKLRFRAGDVIFGRRRAYQKKVALADFDGICSAHALVLRAKPEVAIPQFLPLFMQSDLFFDRALSISVGSLSPTINWKDLARQEFDLPPTDEQRRIAAVLWAAEAAGHASASLLESLTALRRSAIDAVASGGGSQLEKLVELVQYGLSLPGNSSGAYPLLRMTNLSDGQVTAENLQYVDLDAKTLESFRLQRGDVLFNRTNSVELVGRSGLFDLPGDYVFASYLVRVRTNRAALLPAFLTAFLNSDRGQRLLRQHMTKGVSQANINAKKLVSINVPVPTMAVQVALVDRLEAINSRMSEVRAHLAAGSALRRRLAARLLEGAVES